MGSRLGLGPRGRADPGRRGLAVRAAFVVLFAAVATAATVPTLFLEQDVGPYFRTWALAGPREQAASYAIAFAATSAAFLLIYRLTPNVGQRLRDVWPGASVAGGLFLALGQAFPVYLRLTGGVNRYGAALGLLTLLLAWFAAPGHVLLFGHYVNVSYRRRHKTWLLSPVEYEAATPTRPGRTRPTRP